MSLHLDARPDGSYALFIEGDLQFDTRDEALYHESLALPALCLARSQQPAGCRVLICGGGDGLALRECLRFPGVSHVDLVDYAPDVVELGRTRFAAQNRDAFADPRVTVAVQDAWDFLPETPLYDVILCDFTVPRRPEETRVFTREWYARIGQSLLPEGVAAFNAVSPQTTPEAFWCLHRTIRASGLHPLPYRVCLPSFREQGYGVWAFLLGAHRPLQQAELRQLECPAATHQIDMRRLWRGARFSQAERRKAQSAPIHTLAEERLLPLLLNPGRPALALTARSDGQEAPYSIEPLLRSIPILHPYHTREMVETLAAQVMGTIRTLDIERLVEALLRRAAELPRDLLGELRRLRDYLRERFLRFETLGRWSYKLFAALVILMTLANAVAPDNAFAKGSAGIGHASMSRGYGGGSFGGERGFSSVNGGRSAGSFGGERGVGGSFGRIGGFGSESYSTSSARIVGAGFRRSYARSGPTDIYGYSYSPRIFEYCGSGVGHIHPYYATGGGGARPVNAPLPQRHQALFVADDDMLVMENGDVIVTLSDTAYLLVTGGTVALMSSQAPDPLAPLYPAPNFFKSLEEQLRDQQAAAQAEIKNRQDWLAWVGWTSALFRSTADDKLELKNLQDLSKRLDLALSRLGKPPEGATPVGQERAQQVELFVGSYLTPEGTIALRAPDDRWLSTDGQQMWRSDDLQRRPCPPHLKAALKSVLAKLEKEMQADRAAQDNDLKELEAERDSLAKDLTEYKTILAANGYQGDYEVDYGTDEIPVSEAIARTQSDIQTNRQESENANIERARQESDCQRVSTAVQSFGK